MRETRATLTAYRAQLAQEVAQAAAKASAVAAYWAGMEPELRRIHADPELSQGEKWLRVWQLHEAAPDNP